MGMGMGMGTKVRIRQAAERVRQVRLQAQLHIAASISGKDFEVVGREHHYGTGGLAGKKAANVITPQTAEMQAVVGKRRTQEGRMSKRLPRPPRCRMPSTENRGQGTGELGNSEAAHRIGISWYDIMIVKLADGDYSLAGLHDANHAGG